MASVPSRVLAAFGAAGTPQVLTGGQGTSVVVNGLVLKPGADLEEIVWLADLCARVEPRGFRLPAPVPTVQGELVVDGWSAMTLVAGGHVNDRDRSAEDWLSVLAAGRAFHRAVSREQRPAFLAARTHRWAVADRAAWGDPGPPSPGPRSEGMLDRLNQHLVDENLNDQLIHGDLSGNVLVSEGLAPAVIDVSPYWRPAAYADAVVMVDAILWWQADSALLELGQPRGLNDRIWTSLLARAVAFRLLASHDLDEEFDRYERVARLLDSRER